MAKIRFSSAIQAAVNNAPETQFAFDGTVAQLLEKLGAVYGDNFRKRIFDQQGKPRKFLNIYVNGKDIRFKDGFDTKVSDKDEIDLIPAVSGG